MFKQIASIASTLALTLSLIIPASAGSVTQNLSAILPVSAVCSISGATNFNFTSIEAGKMASGITVEGGILTNCAGSSNSLELNDFNGQNGPGSFTLSNGANTLPLSITAHYNGGPAVSIGDANTSPFTVLSGSNFIYLDASVPSGNIAYEGEYTDNITATVNSL